jgi:YD repeat-containing protein
MLRLAVLALVLVAAPALSQQQEELRYTWDANGRLTRVDYGNGRAINYTYDAAGRLVRRVVEAPEATPPETPAPATAAGKQAGRGERSTKLTPRRRP